MPKLTIAFFDAGGGHRNAANAVKAAIEQQHLAWQIELLNLQELFDEIDPLQRIARIRLQEGYNLLLRKGWTRFSAQMLAGLHTVIRLWHVPVLQRLKSYWKVNPTDLVLSVIPNFNRALGQSIRATLADAKFVTLLTDFADYPPHFWIESDSQFLICGTERALQQAIALGHDRDHVFQTSGMVLHPRFYEPQERDCAAARKRLGLCPDWPTGLVLFGGHGSSVMLKIAQQLSTLEQPLQLIFVCGHNERLATALRNLPVTKPMFVEGFTDRVSHYMSISDLFIGKPGPGSITEALHFHLPVIVECTARTLPQERYNAEWIARKEVGVVLSSFDRVADAVKEMLAPQRLRYFKENAAAHRNTAVYEVVEILRTVMDSKIGRAGLQTEELIKT